MSNFSRARKSTKRLSFAWTVVTETGETVPFDLTGSTLKAFFDTEKVETNPSAPVRLAETDLVITNFTGGTAYCPITLTLTGVAQKIYFEVWITDANGELWVLDSGTLNVTGSLM